MIRIFSAIYFLMLSASCTHAQPAQQPEKNTINAGGPCEGCEAIYESEKPFDQLEAVCWMPGWKEKGTRLAVNGIVYKSDSTPAAGVIIYIYHTDQKGIYPLKGNEKGWGIRHGYLRGWIKTNEKGEYKFFTLKPAAYPGFMDPAHIHVTIKEPGIQEYWIDDFVFDDDPLLTAEQRRRYKNRGGSGVLHTTDTGNMLTARRDIYLGKNIPDYPKQ